MNDALTAVRACKHLFLERLWEPSVNELRVVFVEAGAGNPVDPAAFADDPALQSLLIGARAIAPTHLSKVFELAWPSYVAYSVRNESFIGRDDYEVFEGRMLVKYSRSRYLDFVASATFADADFPGPLQHWGLFCEDHVIDVVAAGAPIVTMLAGAGAAPATSLPP